MPITEREKEEYVEKKGIHCPYCKSDSLFSNYMFQSDGGHAWQDVECIDCKKRWKDVYVLGSIEEAK